LDAEKAKIRQSHILILYSVFGTIYAFLGPYPYSKLNPKEVEKAFPRQEDCKPVIFSKYSFYMSFMSQRIFRLSPSFLHASTYSKWIKKFEAKKALSCKNLGISGLDEVRLR